MSTEGWNDPGWKQAALDHLKDANGKSANDLGATLQRRLADQRAEQEARIIAEMAEKDPVAYDQERKKAADDLGIRTATLDAVVQKRKPTKKPSDDDSKDRIKDFERDAGDLILEPDVLARFGETVEAGGLIGETTNAKILYLAQTSRLFERPVSIAIKGVSAGGKSFTVESVLRFFPPEAYFERTGMSEHALPYSDEDFQHRHIVVYEHAGMDSDKVAYFIRTLLSENRISYETVEKTDEGLKARLIEKLGPTGIITTTTSAALHPENETRILSLGVVDSPEQTAAVMRVLGTRAAGGGKADDGEQPNWVAFQRWLALGETRVVVPFGRTLAENVPPVAVRLRRDFGMLVALISAHALLHRSTRAADKQGRVVATIADYAAIYDLVANLFAEGLEATVRPVVRETVEAVRAMGQPELSLIALARKLKLDKNTVHNRVKKAIASGFLANNETKRGRPARIVLGDPLPAERQILPAPKPPQKHCLTGTPLKTPPTLQHPTVPPTGPSRRRQKIGGSPSRPSPKSRFARSGHPRSRRGATTTCSISTPGGRNEQL
jgi:hypothetical protein